MWARQVAWCRDLHPEQPRDLALLDAHGLLTPRTVRYWRTGTVLIYRDGTFCECEMLFQSKIPRDVRVFGEEKIRVFKEIGKRESKMRRDRVLGEVER